MATKTFPYSVIWHGKLIPANTPIEIKEAKVSEKETVVEEAKEKPKKKGADK